MRRYLLISAFMTSVIFGYGQTKKDIKAHFSSFEFKYKELSGIGYEKGVTRRDPSDIIEVKGTYYVYYTKVFGVAPGYWGTLWYATSKDEGYTWKEKGEILGVGKKEAFDSQATFTPNILAANGKYYLYYTGVKPTPGNPDGEFENNNTTDITAIGLAVSDSPDGPFLRLSDKPILKVSPEPEKFDSYRVDDTAMLYRNGIYWLYYKGRGRAFTKGPHRTGMGVAFSKSPEGPFVKLDKYILPGAHEIMIWQQGNGIGAMSALTNTFEFADDAIDFTTDRLSLPAKNRPIAPGVFRQDLTDPTVKGEGLEWGISMGHINGDGYLMRFKIMSQR